MAWLDQLTDVLGRRRPVDCRTPDVGYRRQLVGAAPPESVQEAVKYDAPRAYKEPITPCVRGTDLWGDRGRSTLGRLASRWLRNLLGDGDLGVQDHGILNVIVNQHLTQAQTRQRLTSQLRSMQRTFPGRILEVIAYDLGGERLARLTWDPQTQEERVIWRR
jgi:hypothetical protein